MLTRFMKWMGRRQNDGSREVGAAFLSGEAKYRKLHESLRDGYVFVDMAGRIREFNEIYRQMLGYESNELLNLTYVDLTPKRWHALEQKIVQEQILPNGYSSVYEKEYRRKDGTIFPVELRTSLFMDENGINQGMWAIVRDITKRKKMEEDLRKNEEKYRLLFDNAGDAILILDDDGRMLAVNSLAIERYGYTREELMSMTIDQVDTPEESRFVPERIERLMQQGHFNFETVHQCKDGSIIPMVVSARRVIWDGIPAMICICHDITERKRDEKALRASEEKFHNFVEQSSEGFALIDEQGVIIEWNRACEEITGWTHSQVVGEPFWDIQHRIVPPEDQTPENYERRKKMVREALQTGLSPIFNSVFEAQLMMPSGERRFFRQTVFPIKTQLGYQIGFVSHNITERKKAEASLRESEEKYRQLFEVESDAIFLLDNTSGAILDANASAALLYGYSRAEMMQMRNLDLLAPDDNTHKIVDERHSLTPIRYHCKKDGTIFPVEITSNDLALQGRSVKIAAVRDITERKRAEEALRHLSTHDTLTGIFNRAFFEAELERLEPSRDFPVSIVVGDLDNMKTTNDTLGHAVGDELLKNVARVLRETFRAADIIARIGGDEFAVLLPNTDMLVAGQLLSRVHTKLEEYNIQHPELPILLSLGASTSEQGRLMEAFVIADQKMYKEKALRKMRIE